MRTAEEVKALAGRVSTLIAMIEEVIARDWQEGRIYHAEALESGVAALKDLLEYYRRIHLCECPLYAPKSMSPL